MEGAERWYTRVVVAESSCSSEWWQMTVVVSESAGI